MKTNLHLIEKHVIVLFQRRNMCLKPKLRHNLSIKTKSGVRRVFSLSLFTAGFAGLLTHLNCLNGLRYMLNFNMPLGFSKCGRRVWHVWGVWQSSELCSM